MRNSPYFTILQCKMIKTTDTPCGFTDHNVVTEIRHITLVLSAKFFNCQSNIFLICYIHERNDCAVSAFNSACISITRIIDFHFIQIIIEIILIVPKIDRSAIIMSFPMNRKTIFTPPEFKVTRHMIIFFSVNFNSFNNTPEWICCTLLCFLLCFQCIYRHWCNQYILPIFQPLYITAKHLTYCTERNHSFSFYDLRRLAHFICNSIDIRCGRSYC